MTYGKRYKLTADINIGWRFQMSSNCALCHWESITLLYLMYFDYVFSPCLFLRKHNNHLAFKHTFEKTKNIERVLLSVALQCHFFISSVLIQTVVLESLFQMLFSFFSFSAAKSAQSNWIFFSLIKIYFAFFNLH